MSLHLFALTVPSYVTYCTSTRLWRFNAFSSSDKTDIKRKYCCTQKVLYGLRSGEWNSERPAALGNNWASLNNSPLHGEKKHKKRLCLLKDESTLWSEPTNKKHTWEPFTVSCTFLTRSYFLYFSEQFPFPHFSPNNSDNTIIQMPSLTESIWKKPYDVNSILV